MRIGNVRVILASEHPGVRHLLREMVEEEPGTAIVGQAENTAKALSLARSLRPDVAIIDSHLPHVIGLDTIPLSRIGGLDTAQATSEEIPNMRVILLDTDTYLPERALSMDSVTLFFREVSGVSTPFTLHELCGEEKASDGIVFANVETETNETLQSKVAGMSNKAVLFGGLGILAGLCLIATMFLAGAGAFLALGGFILLFLGVAGRLATRLWPKASHHPGSRDGF